MAYIYSITNNINGKQYIGKTTQPNPYDRWKQHLQLAKNKNTLSENNSVHSMPICRAISKYGESNFKFRVLEECTDDNVNEREKHYIEKYNTADGIGYNCTYGGEGVSKPKKYWGNHPNSKAVSCYTLEGEWIRDYDTAGLAAYDILNRKPSSSEKGCIRSCIKGITFQALGHRWSLKGEQPKVVEKRINRRGKVYGIHPESGRKKVWNSAADCAEEIIGNRTRNLMVTNSLNSPNNNKLQAHGWYFFRNKSDALGNWKKASRIRPKEHYQHAAKISAEKRKKPVRGVNIKTGEEVYFDSMSEASFFIKGHGNYTATSSISNNIKRIQNGDVWCYSFGYRWYYL